ncbi:cupin domain-containing protein [Aeoliella mucimassa]|uniref:Cupin domain protein n=1 Tax=Aeoliella mucimassa TaxID=2527972 RepID=A0A518AW65_9BACT|nr:cupin domain-containing protein [Aeoliella mucimassa]QDU58963.1 Cupin domain protein [Aeoliella mucimassa]
MRQSYEHVTVGPMTDWMRFRFQLRDLPPAPKRFLKNELSLSAMEISVNSMPAGAAMPFLHKHRKNEEVFLFLTGEGEFQAGDDLLPVTPGFCIRCSPETPRSFRNTGDVPMEYVVIQAESDSYTGQGETNDGEPVEAKPAWIS